MTPPDPAGEGAETAVAPSPGPGSGTADAASQPAELPAPELLRAELPRPGPLTAGSSTAGTVTTGPLTTGPLTTGPEVPLLPLGNGPGLPATQPFAAGPGAAPATAPRPDVAGSSTPGLAAPALSAPGLTAPGLSNPGLSTPGLSNPGLAAPPWLTAPGPSASWQRLSRRSMVVRPLTDLVRLLPLLAGLILLHAQTGGGLVWGIAAAVFAVITGLVHWVTTRYQITAERVYLRRGLLNQKTLSVARDRIRTVDVTAHVLHRVLGVCRVSIGTGRNDLRSAESFHLDGVTRAEADSLRLILLPGLSAPGTSAQAAQAAQAHAAQAAQAARTPQAAAPAATAPAAGPGTAAEDPAIVELELGWLRFAPLTLTGLVVLGVLFGAVLQFTNVADVNLAAARPVQRVVADFTALSVVQRVVVGGSVAMAGYVLIAMIGYVLVFWNFRLSGLGAQTLRVTRGLLSVRATTISMSRLRGVEISEPLLLRAAKGARCIAIATGLHIGRGAEREGSVLVPPAPRAVAHRVASLVLGVSDAITSGPLRQHGPAARRRRYVRALAAAVVLIAGICIATWARHGPAWVWIGSFILVPGALLVAADRYRSLGHLLADGWLISRTGSLARRRTIISADAIIGWRVHQTWFQRRLGLMTLTATTAAGQQHYSVHDVPVADGLALARSATGDLMLPFLERAARRDLSVIGRGTPPRASRPAGQAARLPGGREAVVVRLGARP